MRKPVVLLLLLLGSIESGAAVFEGVEYQAPAGWTSQNEEGALGFIPDDVTPEKGTVIVLAAAESLKQAFDAWFQQKLAEELVDGSKVLQASEVQSQRQGEVQTATIVRVVQDPGGTATIRMYHGVTDGRKAAIAIAMAISEEAVNAYSGSIQSFFGSMMIQGSGSASITQAQPSVQRATGSERVPDSTVVNGVPQGIFVGRSLLTGKTVCLMFLSNGRITRAVPTQDLDAFDWSRHQSDYPGDSGTWQIRSGQLSIHWGDGGVHEGPLKVNVGSIEFYGKTYIKPVPATLGALAGKWESVRGTAIAGSGSALIMHTLTIEAGGRFHWHAGGGSSGPWSTYEDVKDMRGTLKIQGRALIFQGDDGTVESYTFLVTSGEPLSAFALGRNMFTRTE